jgi:membrane-associated phospholipid phosphatase
MLGKLIDNYRCEQHHQPHKDNTASKDSFPGDHGMMLLIFASFMWRYFGLRAFIIALDPEANGQTRQWPYRKARSLIPMARQSAPR